MEHKLVNENKLKITLTNEDMAFFDITYEEMINNDEDTQLIFREIYDGVKHKIGFDAEWEDVEMFVRPEKGGGCFVYATKKSSSPNQKSDPYTYEKKYKSKLYTSVKKKRMLYMFENSETLFEACSQVNSAGYTGKSDIFADASRYYLYIEDNREQSLELISEYGILINNPLFSFYLDEHTKKIISSDAVKKFAGIF